MGEETQHLAGGLKMLGIGLCVFSLIVMICGICIMGRQEQYNAIFWASFITTIVATCAFFVGMAMALLA